MILAMRLQQQQFQLTPPCFHVDRSDLFCSGIFVFSVVPRWTTEKTKMPEQISNADFKTARANTRKMDSLHSLTACFHVDRSDQAASARGRTLTLSAISSPATSMPAHFITLFNMRVPTEQRAGCPNRRNACPGTPAACAPPP
eukprot:SAG31_NODE_1075_length_10048_cov_21.627701_8_plen_143_part_00